MGIWCIRAWFAVERGSHGRDCLQALSRDGLRQEGNGSKSAALPMQGLRLQFHEHAAARQAARNEGSGADALCHGQYELLQHCSPSRGQRCRGSQVGS